MEESLLLLRGLAGGGHEELGEMQRKEQWWAKEEGPFMLPPIVDGETWGTQGPVIMITMMMMKRIQRTKMMRVPPGANGELWCTQGTVDRSPFASCNLSPITNLMAANIIHNDTIMKNIFSKNWRVDLSIFYKRNVDKTRLLVASNQKSNSLSTLENLPKIVTDAHCSFVSS